ncbi:SAM-dependent DNA methyltransferase [Oceanispirochaeta crateris]|uniref:site-specific DNA-methyltransferase (adenine-specific) n=1 Tax=Oceanispirochaeta crateris TaxID=2518645 RepID=A0A5C1QI57_9SPIO|nr:SAM-dependent DNA methyltransferase [Oceanispirochaeta crateris]QEN06680.1 SAM-dependent DNA methyltransferase [Oceanispirochaeta crateris]
MNKVSPKSKKDRKKIGAFFTPLWIAEEMIRAYDIHKKWASGASVLDPTAGNGRLLEALIRVCQKDRVPLTSPMLNRLRGYEREKAFTLDFNDRMENEYELKIQKEILVHQDFLKVSPQSWDILLGNPPWLNFTDVPDEDKEELKVWFKRYGLINSGKKILLGHSRIDLAALIIQKAMQDHLKPGGEGYFFIPLSLLLNEGAHNAFRKGILQGDRFCFQEIRDFGTNRVFQEVSTRCGFSVLKKSEPQEERIPYLTLSETGQWTSEICAPVGEAGSSYRIQDDILPPSLIRISRDSRPRQGINTGGRNHIFIFDAMEKLNAGILRMQNKRGEFLLPEDLVYPLITNRQFRNDAPPNRFVFLPYNKMGKALDEEELKSYPHAWQYLQDHKDQLTNRKGSMLGSTMKNGRFWTLLGVGPYTFSSWKIVWEAYGKKEFNPRIFNNYEGKIWIPNQALQAACSFETEEEATRVLSELKHPGINRILKQQNMEGTCNWAQPGRISHFMQLEDHQ